MRLLDRGPRGIVPTPYGRALIRRSVAVFDELKLGVKDLEFLADPTAGEVRIAAAFALATGFVAAVIDRFARRHLRVVCHQMIEGTAIYRALEVREVDLVIAFIAAPIVEDHMEAELLYAYPLLVVVATKNPLSRRRKLRLADLMNEPWTMPPPESEFGATFADTFRAAGLDLPAATVVSTNSVARIALVAEGRFLTMTYASTFRFAGRDIAIKALPIDLPGTRRPVAITTLKNRTLTPVAQLFVDCAREVAKSMAMPRRQQLQKA